MKQKLSLPPFRLCGQTFLFAWRMCLFFSVVLLSFAANPLEFLVGGRIAYLAAFALGLAIAVALERKTPAVVTGTRTLLVGTVLACGGTGLIVYGSTMPDLGFSIVVVGYILSAFGDASFVVAFGKLYSALSIKLSMKAIPLSMACAAVAYFVLTAISPVIAIPLVVALPLAAGAVLWRALSFEGSDVVFRPMAGEATAISPNAAQETAEGTMPNDRPTTKAGDARKDRTVAETPFTKWRISLQTSVFWFAFGVMWPLAFIYLSQNSSERGFFSLSVAILTALVAILLLAASYVLKWNTARSFWIFAPFVVVGISIVAVLESSVQAFAFALVFSARLIAETQLISHFAAISRKNRYPSTLLFGRGFTFLSLGEMLGVLVGQAIAPLQSTWFTVVLLAISNIVVIVLIMSILRVNNTLQRNEIEAALIGEREKQADSMAPADGPEYVSQVLAQAHGLSAREREVAELLLSGRNMPHIAEKLHISPSTVHTHVKHIYEKAGVHTRQELLDLGEAESLRMK